MQYLCCVFAPNLSFFRSTMDFFADLSKWVEAKDPLAAIREYKTEYIRLLGPGAIRYVRVLSEREGGQNGECGREDALKIMNNYYEEHQ